MQEKAMKDKIPPRLKKALENDEVVIFVGAGLSSKFINTDKKLLGGWSNLVRQILAHLEQEGYNVEEKLKRTLEENTPLEVLRLMELEMEKGDNYTKNDVYEFLKEFLELSLDNDYDLHKELCKLSNKVITTNYDTALEENHKALRRNIAYKGRDYEIGNLKRANSFLLKLHGCHLAADSMVLFPADYEELYHNEEREAKHVLKALENIIYNKTILFVGTSMGDYQINRIFQEIREIKGKNADEKHFIITKEELNTDELKFLFPIEIAEFKEIKPLVEEMLKIKESVTPAEVQKKAQKATVQKTEERLVELADATDSKALQEKKALEFFMEGLLCSLDNKHFEAIAAYRKATLIDKNFYKVFNNWGVVLAALACLQSDKDKDAAKFFFEEAFEKYEKVIAIKSDSHEAFYNWGSALDDAALLQSNEDKADTLYKAIEKYEKAIAIKPDKIEAFNNLGNTLSELAKLQSGKASEDLLIEACKKYEKAIEIKPNFYEVFYNWGSTLSDLAKLQSDEAAVESYMKSCEKYEKATDIKEDYYKAFYNWGSALAHLARLQSGNEQEKSLKSALEKFEKAIEIKPDFAEAIKARDIVKQILFGE